MHSNEGDGFSAEAGFGEPLQEDRPAERHKRGVIGPSARCVGTAAHASGNSIKPLIGMPQTSCGTRPYH